MPRSFERRPCRICRHWFRPDPRVGERQYACSAPECQLVRQLRNEDARLVGDPGYFRGRAEKQRAYRERTRKRPPPVRRERSWAGARHRVVHKAIALELTDPQGFATRVSDHDVHKAIAAQLSIVVGLVARLSRSDVHKPTDFDLVALHDQGRRLLGGGGERDGRARSG